MIVRSILILALVVGGGGHGVQGEPGTFWSWVHETPAPSLVGSSLKNRHPLPCIRRYESGGRYHIRGTYLGAYQVRESTYKSVSNARQDALWPKLHLKRYWPEQDRAAWRLFEIRGLSRWSNKVRRFCR